MKDIPGGCSQPSVKFAHRLLDAVLLIRVINRHGFTNPANDLFKVYV